MANPKKLKKVFLTIAIICTVLVLLPEIGFILIVAPWKQSFSMEFLSSASGVWFIVSIFTSLIPLLSIFHYNLLKKKNADIKRKYFITSIIVNIAFLLITYFSIFISISLDLGSAWG